MLKIDEEEEVWGTIRRQGNSQWGYDGQPSSDGQPRWILAFVADDPYESALFTLTEAQVRRMFSSEDAARVLALQCFPDYGYQGLETMNVQITGLRAGETLPLPKGCKPKDIKEPAAC